MPPPSEPEFSLDEEEESSSLDELSLDSELLELAWLELSSTGGSTGSSTTATSLLSELAGGRVEEVELDWLLLELWAGVELATELLC